MKFVHCRINDCQTFSDNDFEQKTCTNCQVRIDSNLVQAKLCPSQKLCNDVTFIMIISCIVLFADKVLVEISNQSR